MDVVFAKVTNYLVAVEDRCDLASEAVTPKPIGKTASVLQNADS